jgi:hypothetical protein
MERPIGKPRLADATTPPWEAGFESATALTVVKDDQAD